MPSYGRQFTLWYKVIDSCNRMVVNSRNRTQSSIHAIVWSSICAIAWSSIRASSCTQHGHAQMFDWVYCSQAIDDDESSFTAIDLPQPTADHDEDSFASTSNTTRPMDFEGKDAE
eukprot:scpid103823/ scgid10468/ 